MPIQNNASRSIDLLANDLRALLQVAEANRQPAPPPAPAAVSERIGRMNTALVELRSRRATLNPRQERVVDEMGQFYQDTISTPTNSDIFYVSSDARQNLPEADQITLQRRASFLLNGAAFGELPHAIDEISEEAGIIGYSKATLMINAIANSVKSQIEHVNAAALQDAQRGDRVCPMTLQPAKFSEFLKQHDRVLREIVDACQLPARSGEPAIKKALEMLATGYFRQATNYPGAPTIRPDEVQVQLNSEASSSVKGNARNHIIAFVKIDNGGAEEFCRNPLPKLDDCEDFETIYRARLLQGFDHHSPQKKRAALLIQLMLQEVSELQEVLGMESANIPSHSQPAKRAAIRSSEEMRYAGSEALTDITVATEDAPAQRDIATRAMKALPGLDVAFEGVYHSPLITNALMRKWVHSPEMFMDLRGLAEPSARLQLQVSPLTGQALLDTPAFRSPD